MPKLEVLVPKATTNYVKNPSFRDGMNGWSPEWNRQATFEDGQVVNSMTGADSVVNNIIASGPSAILGNFGAEYDFDGSNAYLVFTTGLEGSYTLVLEFDLDISNYNFNGNRTLVQLMSDGLLGYALTMIFLSGTSEFRFSITTDAGAEPATDYDPGDLSQPFHVRLEWGTGDGPNSGFYRAYIDGVLAADHSGIDNDTQIISSDGLRIGVTNAPAGDAGSIYYDNIQINYEMVNYNGGTFIEKSYDEARFGNTSAYIHTYGLSAGEGILYVTNAFENTLDQVIVASVYARGSGKVRLRLRNGQTGSQWMSDEVQLHSTRWKRISVRGRSAGSDWVGIYLETTESVETDFYADGAQIEPERLTTYCDGTIEGCRWNGPSDAAQSSRNAFIPSGGYWDTLIDTNCKDKNLQNLYATLIAGGGMPPTVLLSDEYAIADGGFIQGRSVKPRPLTINFHIKQESYTRPISMRPLHELREKLINYIRPDRAEIDAPAYFRYTVGEESLLFSGNYASGLEGNMDVRNQWFDSFPVRFIMFDPYFYADNQEVAVLNYQDAINPGSTGFLVRSEGVYSNIGISVDTTGNGGVLKINPSNGRKYTVSSHTIYEDKGDGWEAIGVLNGGVFGTGALYDIAFAPNGDVYIGGTFSSIDGAAFSNIAYYDISAKTWNALGAGVVTASGIVAALGFDYNGNLYAGGSFTAGGGDTGNYIQMWDGVDWYTVGGNSGLNNIVLSIAFSVDGKTGYVAGQFTDEFGNPGTGLNYVAQFAVDTRLFSTMGTGLDDDAYAIEVSPTNEVFVGGDFTQASGASASLIAKWNGTTWEALGNGLSGGSARVSDIVFLSDGSVIASGLFTTSGDLTSLSGMALWNGSSWSSLDSLIGAAGGSLRDAEVDARNDDIYLRAINKTLFGGLTNVENTGDRSAIPILFFKGQGKLRWVENVETGERLYLNYDIQADEELEIDLEQQSIISTFTGRDYTGLLANSDMGSFKLLPETSRIVVFIWDDISAVAQLRYTPRYWSLDGVSA